MGGKEDWYCKWGSFSNCPHTCEQPGTIFTEGNKDDPTEAIHGLDIFTKNWCMNCKETEEKNEPIFRCNSCAFSLEEGKCLIKKFVHEIPGCDHDYPLDKFGSMSR